MNDLLHGFFLGYAGCQLGLSAFWATKGDYRRAQLAAVQSVAAALVAIGMRVG